MLTTSSIKKELSFEYLSLEDFLTKVSHKILVNA